MRKNTIIFTVLILIAGALSFLMGKITRNWHSVELSHSSGFCAPDAAKPDKCTLLIVADAHNNELRINRGGTTKVSPLDQHPDILDALDDKNFQAIMRQAQTCNPMSDGLSVITVNYLDGSARETYIHCSDEPHFKAAIDVLDQQLAP